MKIRLEQREEELVLHAQGRIDTYTAGQFEKALLDAIEKAGGVRIDFQEVEFVSSAGLRALLNGQKKVNEQGKEMICCNINEIVESVLESTGFLNVLLVE